MPISEYEYFQVTTEGRQPMDANEDLSFNPDWVSPPGDTIRDICQEKGITYDSLKDITPLVTWRAACAERPPTGPGNVTALCEGKRTAAKGGAGVFFWQKSHQGKLKRGYFECGAE